MSKPTTYKPEYCQMLVEHMEKGYSFASFGADVNTGRRTLYDWCEKFPEFEAAHQEGLEKGKKMFETILLAKVRGKELAGMDLKKSDTTCLIFALKTRYRDTYNDKAEVEINHDKIKITISQEDSGL